MAQLTYSHWLIAFFCKPRWVYKDAETTSLYPFLVKRSTTRIIRDLLRFVWVSIAEAFSIFWRGLQLHHVTPPASRLVVMAEDEVDHPKGTQEARNWPLAPARPPPLPEGVDSYPPGFLGAKPVLHWPVPETMEFGHSLMTNFVGWAREVHTNWSRVERLEQVEHCRRAGICMGCSCGFVQPDCVAKETTGKTGK